MINCLSNIAPVFVDDYATYLATPSAANCGTGFTLLASGLAGLRLQSTSTLIDAGTNKPWMVGTFDYSGTNARIANVIVDIGAFEYLAGAATAVPEDYTARALLLWRMMQ